MQRIHGTGRNNEAASAYPPAAGRYFPAPVTIAFFPQMRYTADKVGRRAGKIGKEPGRRLRRGVSI